MILRPNYTNNIMNFIDIKLVKVLVGIRRCGKSTILEMIKDLIRSRGVDNDNIISRNYNDFKYNSLDNKEMFYDIVSEFKNDNKYYLFLDEIQEIEGWEKAVNNLQEAYNVDIYVTGSNSKLMASEISTYLSGRYVSIPVYTLTFKEFIKFNDNTNNLDSLFEQFLRTGGFPLVAATNMDAYSAYQAVEDIYNTVITYDISRRHNIRNRNLFDRIVRYIVENVGKTFSVNSIIKYLKSENINASSETIYNYITWLEEAFIIYPCNRYNIQGKNVLKSQEKYFLSDISLKYSIFGFNPTMVASILENIVYLELRSRGYKVYVGKNEDKEIDFIAVNRDDKIYVQVCRNLPLESDREINNLLEIRDNYHKYVVTMDNLAIGNVNGIKLMHIKDFLLLDNL